ncbi:hypothetical protein B0H13DRAFT_2667684 [Mycena leptocephala]|nr:hypothetical protein B0H13DRAFT_2667684 [Mycena leptocephala]
MYISIVVSQLGVLSCAVGVLGLRGVPGVRVSPVTRPPASISSLAVSSPSATLSTSASAFHTNVISVVSALSAPISATTKLSVPPSSSSSLSTLAPATATITSSLGRRAAIPACLKTVELSCLNLTANCIDSVNSGNFNNLWGIKSCVAAATCYGVGDLITSVECQTGLTVTNAGQASLDYNNIYAVIIGSCAFASGGCPMTQQNFIDFYYGTLTAINTANFPSSSAVVVGLWNAITAWAATGSTVPYLNFNDWLHFSSFPSTTTTAATLIPTYTEVDWNPNPAPPSGAVSETFVKSTTTVIIVIPTITTTVIVAGASITLAPGGTPINGPLPSDVFIPGAVTPTWNPNIIPPTSVSSVTFTAPPAFTTVVAVPTASNSPPKNITGPPGDKNSNGDDWWLLLFPGIIGGLLPADIGIPGGFKPTAAPPPGWTGPWTDPDPTSSSTSTKSSSASSSSSSSSCPQPTSVYALSDDSADADWEDLGTDPDRRRNTLEARAGRTISLSVCGIKKANGNTIANPNTVSLGAGTYYSIGTKAAGGVGTVLTATNVNGRPVGNGPNLVNQEHVFELGYLSQYFTSLINNNGITCAWVLNNVYNRAGWDGVTPWSITLLQDIDQAVNMVWVDRPLNQAKSNVVDQDVSTPQQMNINKITDFTPAGASFSVIQDLEYFIRNFATLGTYFGNTAAAFQATALRLVAQPYVHISEWMHVPGECCLAGLSNQDDQFANQVNNGVVPPCFPLYAAGITAQTIPNWQALVPPPPNLPACNSPGTEGNIQFGINPNGTPEPSVSTYRILGSDDPDFYAIGDGADFSDDHFIADALSTQCYLAVNCNGQTGNQVTAQISFVINNQALHCVSIYTNVAAGGGIAIGIICAATTAAATTCANAVLQTTYPSGNLLTGSLEFIPT